MPMLIFVLVRLPIVSVNGYMCNPFNERAAPGECYWHTLPWSRYQIGIYLHLWSVFPATLIAILQFVPAIRTRRIGVHRFLGYICWVLGITAAVTALMICDRSFGGSMATKSATSILAAMCFLGHYKAYKAVRNYHLDKHREWMLRTWIWMGGILTMRPLMVLMALTISFLARRDIRFNAALPCPQAFYMLTNGGDIGISNSKPDFFTTYGFECSPALGMMSTPSTVLTRPNMSPLGGFEAILADGRAIISANLISRRIDFRAAALDLSFGPAFLLGIAINAIIVEWYLRKTSNEAQRLQKLGAIKRKLAEQKKDVNSEKLEEHTYKQSVRLPEPESLRRNVLLLK